MKNILKTGLLIVIAALLVVAYSSTFVVDERQKALVIQFGEIKRTVEKPGLYFKKPIVEDVVFVEDRMLFFESQDMRVQVVDGRRYLVDTITMFRIVDPKRYLESVQANLLVLRDQLTTRLEASLRQTYGKRTFEAALSAERSQMMREIRDQIKPEALGLGIDIVDVRIRRTDLLPEVMKSTYDRMNAERLSEAEQIRAIGNERRIQIRAQADRQAVILVSEARRDSEIIRGQGDGERNKIFAKAFSKDPEFFAFYRSMQAYVTSMKDKGTTMVLSPDSEFFKYFKDSAGAAPTPKK
jgi:membrane protease subunit HflC